MSVPESIEKIVSINDFMQQYQLDATKLQLLLAKARGILVNLEELIPSSVKNHPLIQAGLRAKIPVFLENPAIITDFNAGWKTDNAASAIESMVAALGVSAQVSIVLPECEIPAILLRLEAL